jgi:hypothetical protein
MRRVGSTLRLFPCCMHPPPKQVMMEQSHMRDDQQPRVTDGITGPEALVTITFYVSD